jgi:uncharacterized protein
MIPRLSTRLALVALVTLAFIGVAAPAAPQAPEAPAAVPQPSPTAILLAKEILELKGADKMFDPLVRGVVEKVKDQYMQTDFMWAKDFNEVAAQMEKEYEPRVNELVDISARIYASHFTEPELKSILEFYQSPLGQKVIAEEPKTVDESLAQAGEWGDNLAQEALGKMRAEMKKRGHDI